MEAFVTSLPDRPVIMFLILFGFILVVLLAAALFRLFERKTVFEDQPLQRTYAKAAGGADSDGLINGIPARIMAAPVHHYNQATKQTSFCYYRALFVYEPVNILGSKLLIHRSGLLNRPLEQLAPQVEPQPDWLQRAGYVLRAELPHHTHGQQEKLALLKAFEGEKITVFALQDNLFTVELQAAEMWSPERIKQLAQAGADVAAAFTKS